MNSVYYTIVQVIMNSESDWTGDCYNIFTPIKELYKSSSALAAHSQHIINIQKHFKRQKRISFWSSVNLIIKSFEPTIWIWEIKTTQSFGFKWNCSMTKTHNELCPHISWHYIYNMESGKLTYEWIGASPLNIEELQASLWLTSSNLR